MKLLPVAIALAIATLAPSARADWKGVSAPKISRWDATVSRLPDGRVLLVGGAIASGGATTSVEIFDPKTTIWSDAAPLSVGRFGHTAVTLADGRVLVIGGETTSSTTKVAEVFEPSTATWRTVAPALVTHVRAGAVLLSDGRVAVLGGGAPDGKRWLSSDLELYDPKSDSWNKQTSPTRKYGAGQMIAPLRDGGLLVAGEGSSVAERWSPTMGAWTTHALPDLRMYGEAFALKSGDVLLVGGGLTSGTGAPLLFEPATNTLRALGGLARGGDVSAALLPNGDVVVVGGTSLESGVAQTMELFHAASGAFHAIGSPIAPGVTATLAVGDARVIVFTSTNSVFLGDVPRTCVTDAECSSGHCSDAFCCDDACAGQCEACNVPGSIGACVAITGAPRGERPACSPSLTPACRALTCNGVNRTSCVKVSPAPPCDCTRDDECASGHCADGVCCDRACDQQCEACDMPHARGTCVLITGEPRGTRPGCKPPGRSICSVEACNGIEPSRCVLVNDSSTTCGAICGGRVQQHCNDRGSCGLPHELVCPDAACAVERFDTSAPPRLIDAVFVVALGALVHRARRRRR